jgi:three-Cys-motif partner protein
MDIKDLDKRLKILRWDKHEDLLHNIAEAGGDVYNQFKRWTPLKLCGLSYFAGGYAQILGNLKKTYPNLNVVYIDLFSGCGINKIKNTLIAGSPLVCIDSVTNRHVEFDIMYFNDSNPDFHFALEKRLESLSKIDSFAWIADRYYLLNKDCNEAIENIVDHLKRERFINYLAFIDPYKWEISWSAMENLLSIEYGDIMMTFQARLVAKEIGRYVSQGASSLGENIRRFLGEEDEDVIERLNSEQAVKEYYVGKIREYRKFIVDIEIKGGRSNPYRYYLIFASRKKNPPWGSYITKMKAFVESFSGDLVKASLDYLSGKTLRLF